VLSEAFLAGAIILQISAAFLAVKLIRITGRLAAWVLISIALVLMALRRIIPLAHALLGTGPQPDPLNEFIGLLLSGFMVVGIAMIGPIFKKIFRSERELKESERRFRSYFELPLVGVAIVSADKRWLTVNDRLCEMLGYSRQELTATSLAALSCPEDSEREFSLDGSVAERRAEGYALDKRFIRKDGAQLWTSQAMRCVRDQEGAPSYFVVIIQDITERKRAEDGLRKSIMEKDALIRELYHRTKNNMQMICSILNLESAQFVDPKVVEEFHLIGNKIISMSLVHEMLYISHDLSSIDLVDYIADLCRLLAQSYQESTGRVAFDMGLESVRVPIDNAIPIGLILNELITNSLKYAFPGERKGRIKVRIAKSGENCVELVVADDGVGPPEGFDLKERAGMGLTSVMALTDQIGGKLSFIAGPGMGMEYRISFSNEGISPRV
jgi:PAS domain S-box-containing protein